MEPREMATCVDGSWNSELQMKAKAAWENAVLLEGQICGSLGHCKGLNEQPSFSLLKMSLEFVLCENYIYRRKNRVLL